MEYYRSDDTVVQQVLEGRCVMAVGIRRSGKTSFLKKVGRSLMTRNKSAQYVLLPELFWNQTPEKSIRKAIAKILAMPTGFVLLDEVEAFQGKDRAVLASLLKACTKHTLVVTCAPVFALSLSKYPAPVQEIIGNCHRHMIAPLSDQDAHDLLSQAKRTTASALPEDVITRILEHEDRQPIILQALGAKHLDGLELAVSLASVGTEMLQGLTPKAKALFSAAAYERALLVDCQEAQLLTALGVLQVSQRKRNLSIPGRTMKELIRGATVPPLARNTIGPPEPARKWKVHAKILHLSDLHFGPHCIEAEHPAQVQLDRLKSALDRDDILPDFVTVTGDLSWSGHRHDLEAAEVFLEGLVKWLRSGKSLSEREARRRIVMIPGNHDAAWKLTNALSSKEADDWVVYSVAPYTMLFNRFYRGEVVWDMEDPCMLHVFKSPSVAFLAISTCHFITRKQKEGRFGDTVQDRVVHLLQNGKAQEARFRIGMMHHSLRPFHHDGKVVLDGEAALLKFSRCKPNVDLFLHGHVHHGEVDVVKPRGGLAEIAYSAVGSFGVRAKHRPGDDSRGRVGNEFAVVTLEADSRARRFCTEFYSLQLTTSGGWEWKAGEKTDPHLL